jgi:hypothetical protein
MIIPIFALHRTDKFDSDGSVRCAGNYSSAYEAGSIKLQQSIMAFYQLAHWVRFSSCERMATRRLRNCGHGNYKNHGGYGGPAAEFGK